MTALPAMLHWPDASFIGQASGIDVALIVSDAEVVAVVADPTGLRTLRGTILTLPTTLVGESSTPGAAPTLTIVTRPEPGKLVVVWRNADVEARLDVGLAPDPSAFRLVAHRGGVRLSGTWIRRADGSSRGQLSADDGHTCAPKVAADGTVDATPCAFVARALPLVAEPVTPHAITSARRDGARRFTFLSLGDSYASGEGAPMVDGAYDDKGDLSGNAVFWGDARPIGIPTSLIDDQDRARRASVARACHRSDAAASRVAAASLQAEYPGVAIVHDLFACSGAEVPELVYASDAGYEDCELRSGTDRTDCLRISASLPPNAPLSPQLGQVDDFIGRFAILPDALTVSIGGNDAGFSTILTDCISPLSLSGCHAAGSKARAALAQGLRILPERYATLGKAVRERGLSPGATLVALYPDALLEDDRDGLCSGSDFSAAGDTLLANIDADEAKFAHDATHTLDDAVRGAAMHEGFQVVDAHVNGAAGHSLCARQDPWLATLPLALHSQGHDVMSPLDFLADFNPFRLSAGMVHPNRAGHRELYAPALRAALEPMLVAALRPTTPPPALRVESAAPRGEIAVAWDDASDVETSYRLRVTRVEGSDGPSSTEQRLPPNTLRAVVDAQHDAAFRIEVATCLDGGGGHEWCSDDASLLVANRAPTVTLAAPSVARGSGTSVRITGESSPDPAHSFYLLVLEGDRPPTSFASRSPLVWFDDWSGAGQRVRIASCNTVGCGPLSPGAAIR